MKTAMEFMEVSKYNEALESLESEIQKNPENSEAYYYIGVCYAEIGMYFKIESYFKKAISLDPKLIKDVSNQYYKAALYWYKRNQTENADQYLEKGIELNPEYIDEFSRLLLEHIDGIAASPENQEQIIQLYQVILEKQPENRDVIVDHAFKLANIMISQGLFREGFECADFGLTLSDRYIQETASLYIAHAEELFFNQKRAVEAIAYFEKGLTLDSKLRDKIDSQYRQWVTEYEDLDEIGEMLVFLQELALINADFSRLYVQMSEKYKHDVFTDKRDGQTYKTTRIGDQVWMAENLRYKTNYGSDIAWEVDYEKRYGRLYSWEAAMASCPNGWHLPSFEEWSKLVKYISRHNRVLEIDDNQKYQFNNRTILQVKYTGFGTELGGIRRTNGEYEKIRSVGYWWSSSEVNERKVHFWSMKSINGFFQGGSAVKDVGMSVRYVMD